MKKKKQPASPIKDKEKIIDMQDYLKEKSERDYVLFCLGIATGYRAGDLVSLRVRDVKKALRNGEFSILEGKKEKANNIKDKNKKPRTAIIKKNLEEKLEKYIKGKADYEYMFQSRKKGYHIQVKRVSEILKEAGDKFKLANISAHSMRKTYAYTIYKKNDNDITLVKEMLGHSSIEETKAYLGLDRETYDKCSVDVDDLIQ